MGDRDLETLTVGCRALLLEVIRRAGYDWVLYRGSRRLKTKQIAEDAYHWLFEEKPGDASWAQRKEEGKELTSFLAICEALDLDPEYVRDTIRKLTVKDVLSVGRPATHRKIEVNTEEDEACLPSPDDIVGVGSMRSEGISPDGGPLFTARPFPLSSWPTRFK